MPKKTKVQSTEEISNNQVDYKIANAYLLNLYGKNGLVVPVTLTPTDRSVPNILFANMNRLPD